MSSAPQVSSIGTFLGIRGLEPLFQSIHQGASRTAPYFFHFENKMLNRRQQRAYLDTVDIYLPGNSVGIGSHGEAIHRQWSAPDEPDATEVPCQRVPSQERDNPLITGRQQSGSEEVFHFASDAVLQDQTLLRLTTDGHPDAGRYYVVKGEPTDVPDRGRRRANLRECFALAVAKPEGYP